MKAPNRRSAARSRPTVSRPSVLGAPVFSVSFHPGGRILASGGGDAAVRVWDARTGKQLARLIGLPQAVRAVAFSPDGKLLAAGTAIQPDKKEALIRIWRREE